ncbi:hypothetical protein [Arthrobacter alpinus]|uniref:hypothetical protein n=1 Tax=Arthrobacter alpinus TaxID=656366 RepID=UPI0012FECE81|nr:hypothetical protein [Arthrobacter alpinus]
MVRDETNDRNDTNENTNTASDALTDEQLDEVAGAGGEELGHGRSVLLPKPYPPWPGSN